MNDDASGGEGTPPSDSEPLLLPLDGTPFKDKGGSLATGDGSDDSVGWLSFGAVACAALAVGSLAVLLFLSPPMPRASGAGVTWVTVALYTLPMALASGLGGVPFFWVRSLSARSEGIANAVAAGVMLAVSFDLLDELLYSGGPQHLPATAAAKALLGVCAGAYFIFASQGWLDEYEKTHGLVRLGKLQGVAAKKAIVLVLIMTVHSFGEGSGVGISWTGVSGAEQGLLVTLAIGLHNIPEGLAVALVLVARGESASFATGWAVLSSMGQPLVAVPAFLFAEKFQIVQPVGVGFAAGSMIFIVLVELLPDALAKTTPHTVATAAIAAVVGMYACRVAISVAFAGPG